MRNAVLSAGVILLMLLAVSGCTAPGESIENDPTPTLRTITASEAIILTGSDPTLTIIDVRRADEYAAGHIPGAVNIDISSSFADGAGNLDRDGSYLIYCATGVRGESALKMMGDLGFTEVYNLGGGISAWQRAGGSVVG